MAEAELFRSGSLASKGDLFSESEKAQTLMDLFVKACQKYPNHIAAIYDDGMQDVTMATYRDVLSAADVLATQLQNLCCGMDGGADIIGLFVEPSSNLPSQIIGVLKMPAAFAPIDPKAPPSLNNFFIDQLGVSVILVQSNLLDQFMLGLGECFEWEPCLGSDPTQVSSSGIIPVRLKPSHHRHDNHEVTQGPSPPLAYALHTSGTTGRPKVVRVPHRCIVPNILHLRQIFTITSSDMVFMASPLTFDPSVVEMFIAWSCGATLLMVPARLKMAPRALACVLMRNHVTVLQATPSLISRFSSQSLRDGLLSAGSPLRLLAFGGEACPPGSTLASWRGAGSQIEFFNLYGITEVSSWAACFKIPEQWIEERLEGSIPLGDSLEDTVLQLRDEAGNVMTTGRGKLFIGGVKRVCFLDTEEPVSSGGLVMRATGDVVEVTNRGLLYVGRSDDQVKRHGKRISLSNIKLVIEACSEVQACAVLLCDTVLVAFYIPVKTSSIHPHHIEPQNNSVKKNVPEMPASSLGIPASLSPVPSCTPTISSPVSKPEATDSYAPADQLLDLSPPYRKELLRRRECDEESSSSWQNSSGEQSAVVIQEPSSPVLTKPEESESHLQTDLTGNGPPSLTTELLESSEHDDETSNSWKNSLEKQSSVLFQEATNGTALGVEPGADMSSRLLTHLRGVLPSQSIPDRLWALDELPITRHGKVDTAGLHQLAQRMMDSERHGRRELHHVRTETSSSEDLRGVLVREWKLCLQLAESQAITPSDSFLSLGGDSFQALRLVQSLERAFGAALPDLLDVLLHETFNHVLEVLVKSISRVKCSVGSELTETSFTQDREMREVSDSVLIHGNDAPQSTVSDTNTADESSKFQVSKAGVGESVNVDSNQLLDQTYMVVSSKRSEQVEYVCHKATSKGHQNLAMHHKAKNIFTDLDFALRTEITDEEKHLSEENTEITSSKCHSSFSSTASRKRKLDGDLIEDEATLSTSMGSSPVDAGSIVGYCADEDCKLSIRKGSRFLHHRSDKGGNPHPSTHPLRCRRWQELVGSTAGEPSGKPESLCTEERWKVDTGKCVDASPLVVCSRSSCVVFIGSHSHKFSAIAMEMGQVIWESRLGDRIESSACLSACGLYVIVGCYDHCVYCLSASSGAVYWRYQAGDVVKCSPVCDPANQLVYVGSHDQHVVALDVKEKTCRWRAHCGGGSIFASPCLHQVVGALYVATLRGVVLALSKDTGQKRWSFSCPKPIFASPVATDDGVLIGCVDGITYAVSHTGNPLWTVAVGGPIFSSPCLLSTQTFAHHHDDGHPPTPSHLPHASSPTPSHLTSPEPPPPPPSASHLAVFGSHNGSVTCLDPSTGQSRWTQRVSPSPVYATPFIYHQTDNDGRVVVASTDGYVRVLDLVTGTTLEEFVLPGEVFSSPVVVNSNRLIVGCRNNFVYCFNLW